MRRKTLSQTPYQICTQCRTSITSGQSFCPNCGKPTQEAATHTAPVAPYLSSNATPYSQPNALPYPPYPTDADPYANTSLSGSMQRNMPPPPPSYTPMPSGSSYGFVPTTPPPPPTKKRSPLLLILVGVVALLIILGGAGTFALINASHTLGSNKGSVSSGGSSSNGSSGGNMASSQQVNVTTVYASDQITFTSIQQAAKFADDEFTNYSDHPNYVRVNFKEQQLSKQSSYFSYTSAFHLILADKTVLSSEKAQQYTGPDQAVVRTNWVDFGASGAIDLSQLTMRLGGQEDAQMDIPLKTGADVSKYLPKTTTLNKNFNYATMNWTLKDATQSLYFNGTQAKSGQVYITTTLIANNPGSNELFLDNFVRLKAGGSAIAPDYGSDTSNFDVIKAATSNIQGSVTFLVTPASTYTLSFLASSDNSFAAQSVDFQIS